MKKEIKFYEIQRLIQGERCFLMATRDLGLTLAVCKDRRCTYEVKSVLIDVDDEDMLDALESEDLIYSQLQNN